MPAHVLLVNPNRMRPPVAPVALDLLGTALENAGIGARLCDLAWCASDEDVRRELAGALEERPLLVALTCRNTDDSSLASREYCLADYARVARTVREHTDAPLVTGGSGFSISPLPAMREMGADFAVWGEGELALPELALVLAERGGEDGLARVPGLLWRSGDEVVPNAAREIDLSCAAAPRRTLVDNLRYLAEGAQVGFETSRGCSHACAYCADPISKGRRLRRRSPESVADEAEGLLSQGVDCLHTCDSEMNSDPAHALAVSRAISERGLGERLRWYAYCTPDGFTADVASAMRSAGCAGVNFGVDHTEPEMLATLGRSHSLRDVARAREACRAAGTPVMFDLLLGAPGETRETVRACLDRMRSLDPEAAGVALGLRLYRGTPLGDRLAPRAGDAADGVTGDPRDIAGDLLGPAFYVSPALGQRAAEWLADEVAGDERFLYFGAAGAEGAGDEGASNYNYNANAALERAIAAGARGAYWDILRRARGA